MKKKFDDTQELFPDEIWPDDLGKQNKFLKLKLERLDRDFKKYKASHGNSSLNKQSRDEVKEITLGLMKSKLKELHITGLRLVLIAIASTALFVVNFFSDKIKSWF